MNTVVIIPTYNEAENIEELVRRVFDQSVPVHILIVDDASPDGTGEIAERLAALPAFGGRLHVMHRPVKDGLGRAYIDGFRWALARDYDAMVQMDADLSHDPASLTRLAEAAEDGADMVIGSRYLHGVSVVNWPLQRILLSWGANRYVRAITGLSPHDCTSGFRLLRRRLLEAIDFDAVRSNGYAFQVEITFRAHTGGFRITEVPIVFRERTAGRSKMSGRVIRESALMPFRLRMGYRPCRSVAASASAPKLSLTPPSIGSSVSAPAVSARPALRLITELAPNPQPRNNSDWKRRAFKAAACLCPAWLPEFVYTTLLRPKVLRRAVNSVILKHLPEKVEAHGVTVVLNPHDPVISGALAMGVYESYQTRLIRETVTPGMRVLDIGANVGYYTALCSHLAGAEGQVLAFEPEPTNFSFLEKTVHANAFGQTRLLNTAVGRTRGEAVLHLSEDNKGDHRIYASAETSHRTRITVPVVAIDALLGVDECVDFVKIDVQGAEGLVLDGMRETLRRSPQAVVLTEFWPAGLEDAGTSPLAFLETLRNDLGMDIWEIDNGRKTLRPVADLSQLIARNSGRKYTNLYCARRGSAVTQTTATGDAPRRAA